MERRTSVHGQITDPRSVSAEDVVDFQNAARSLSEKDVVNFQNAARSLSDIIYLSLERLADVGGTVIDDSGVIKVESGQEVIVLRGSIEQIAEFDQVLKSIKKARKMQDSQE